jgi:hypothetical protein
MAWMWKKKFGIPRSNAEALADNFGVLWANCLMPETHYMSANCILNADTHPGTADSTYSSIVSSTRAPNFFASALSRQLERQTDTHVQVGDSPLVIFCRSALVNGVLVR